MFILVNTSVQNVGNLVILVDILLYTCELIQERNRLNALFVANDSQCHVALLVIAEFTVERNHLYVLFATNDSHSQVTLMCTAELTMERNHTNVTCVTRRLVGLEI